MLKMTSLSKQPYSKRAENHSHPLGKRLFTIAEAKKSNLTVSADFTDTKSLLDCADSEYIANPSIWLRLY